MLITNPAPCWRLAHEDGSDYEPYGEGSPHFDSEADALASHHYEQAPDTKPLHAEPLDQACARLECDGKHEDGMPCGETPEDDCYGDIHFPTIASARSNGCLFGFTITDDDHAYCAEHEADSIEDEETTP